MAEEASTERNLDQGTECLPQGKKTECQWCERTFSDRATRDIHLELSHKFPCQLCGMVLPLDTLLQDHLSRSHRVTLQNPAASSDQAAVGNPRKPSQSASAAAVTGSAIEDNLNIVMFQPGHGLNLQAGLCVCHLCGAQFAKTYLSDHMKSVHQGHQYRCSRCPRTFSWRGSLWKHERKCTGEAPPGSGVMYTA